MDKKSANTSIRYNQFDIKLCVICQKRNKTFRVTTSQNGREKIKLVAESKKDKVYDRLHFLQENDHFVYHVNNSCYKRYIKHNIMKNEAANSNAFNDKDFSISTSDNESKLQCNSPTLTIRPPLTTRRSIRIRQCNEQKTPAEQVCIICSCDKSGKNGVKKYKLTKLQRAQQLLEAVTFFKDEVFNRISYLTTPENILNAGLFFHSNCLRSYENAFVKLQKKNVIEDNAIDNCLLNDGFENVCANHDVYEFSDNAESTQQESLTNCSNDHKEANKTDYISKFIENIIPQIRCGEAFTLSDISNSINNKMNLQNLVSNRDIKAYFLKNYENDVSFFHPPEANKSSLVYSSHISASDIVDALRIDTCIKKTAKILRNSIKNFDFGLEDKFCDANELEKAWKNIVFPPPVLSFFAALFNVDEKDLSKETNSNEYVDDDDLLTVNETNDIKNLRAKAIFQILCFTINNGKQKMPFQIMTGLSIFTACKSKSLISSLNRSGISMSYNMVRKHREQLAKYTIVSGHGKISLPTHFDRSYFTTGAFDNFDHNEDTLSGLNASHDTVAVLFQNKPNIISGKPYISKSGINNLDSTYLDELTCQTLRPFTKPTEPIMLPSCYASNPVINVKSKLFANDMAWFITRALGSGESFSKTSVKRKLVQQIPPWAAFNSCLLEDNRPIQIVGYLPILPYPPTQYDTVYSQLINFNEVLQQLDQKYFPIACDEGIYHIAKHIQLCKPDDFSKIVLFLGNFHIIKVFLSCIGKYLHGSGIENIFIETNIFGVGVTDQVLNGTHYSRSVKGFTALVEALKRLQLQAFFEARGTKQYQAELATLDVLLDNFCEKNFVEARKNLQIFEFSSYQIIEDIECFINKRCQESPLFHYWTNVLKFITEAQNLIRADRTGDWLLHLQTVRNILGIFHIMDKTNYARWCSVYYEDMLMLKEKAPEVYRQFSEGRATVKLSNTSFSSVSTDQALEMTYNRGSKSVFGVIGVTQKKKAVATWGITYHEELSIYNLYRKTMSVKNDNEEYKFHHEFSNAAIQQSEDIVDKIKNYIEDHLNPFRSGVEPLRNIITEQLVDATACHQLLNIFELGEKLYEKFRNERFREQSKNLSEVIPRQNLASFQNKTNQQPSTSKKIKKNRNESQRTIELAKERKYCLRKLFSYELTTLNVLFESDENLKIDTKRNVLLELEKMYVGNSNFPLLTKDVGVGIIIDINWICPKVKWKGNETFRDFAKSFCDYVTSLINNVCVTRIDFTHEYSVESLPSIFYTFQNNVISESIELYRIDDDIPLPQQPSKFWSSMKNRILLQTYLQKFIYFRSNDYWPEVEIIFSASNQSPCISNNLTRSLESLRPLHSQNIKNTDMRIILHVKHAVMSQIKIIMLVVSNTNIIVLLLYYWKHFNEIGLQELWIKLDHQKNSKTIPVHIIAKAIGMDLCSVFSAMNNLIGSNLTSVIGTLNAGINAAPVNYLQSFGKAMSDVAIEQNIVAAEQYLANVWKKGTHCKTFNELRYWSYHHGNTMVVEELPPTSASMRLHILRAMYITFIQTNFMDQQDDLDPTLFGYYENDGNYFPQKIHIIIPPVDELPPNCTCKNCNVKSCSCREVEIPCISFCHCP